MKTVLLILVLVCSAIAQPLDLSAPNGTATGSNLFASPTCIITAVGDNDGTVTNPIGATISNLVTPVIGSSAMANGGSFSQGGQLTINLPGTYTGTATFVSGTWQAIRAANGTYTYILSGSFDDGNGQTGSLALVTGTVGAPNVKWNSSTVASVSSFSVHLN